MPRRIKERAGGVAAMEERKVDRNFVVGGAAVGFVWWGESSRTGAWAGGLAAGATWGGLCGWPCRHRVLSCVIPSDLHGLLRVGGARRLARIRGSPDFGGGDRVI
jgi:hypothetical protein